MQNYEEQLFSIINEALHSICEQKPSNPIESLSAKMFEIIGENPQDLIEIRNRIKNSNNTNQTISVNKSVLSQPSINNSFSSFYKIKKKIGHGSYGTVYTTVLTSEEKSGDYQLKAVKIIKKNEKHLSESNSDMLKKLDHPNIIRIHEISEDSNNFYIVMEYCQYGDLLSLLQKKKIIKEKTAKNIMKQIFSALSFLHSNNIIHRDIKPENILISNLGEEVGNGNFPDIQIKLIDFGSARFFNKDYKLTETIGTPFYTAPEVITGKYSFQCDLWSAGVILFTLLCSKPPFEGTTSTVIYRIVNDNYNFQPSHSKESRDFISLLLTKDPKKRISTSNECLEHPYLNYETEDEKIQTNILAVEAFGNMKDFWQGNGLRKQILSYISEHRLYQEDNYACGRIFKELDKNHDGQLDINEIFTYFSSYFVGTEEEEMENIKRMMENIDVNNNGKIDYSEFMIVISKFHRNNEIKVLSEIFEKFDCDGSGFIEVDELKLAFKDDEGLDKSLEELLSDFDSNGDQKLSKEEFIALVTKYY